MFENSKNLILFLVNFMQIYYKNMTIYDIIINNIFM